MQRWVFSAPCNGTPVPGRWKEDPGVGPRPPGPRLTVFEGRMGQIEKYLQVWAHKSDHPLKNLEKKVFFSPESYF